MNKIGYAREKAKISFQDFLGEIQISFEQHALYECGIRPVPIDIALRYCELFKSSLNALFPAVRKLFRTNGENISDLMKRAVFERNLRQDFFEAGLDLSGKNWWANIELPTGVYIFRAIPSDQIGFLDIALGGSQKHVVIDSSHSRIYLNLHNVVSINLGWEPKAHGPLFSDEELFDDFDPFSCELVAYSANKKEPISIGIEETPGNEDALNDVQEFFFSAELENEFPKDQHQSLYLQDNEGDMLWLNRAHLCLVEVPLVNVESSVHRFWLDEYGE